MGTHDNFTVGLRYFPLPEAVRPFFTALHYFAIDCPPDQIVEDCLHPEWAVLRFCAKGPPPLAGLRPAPMEPKPPFVFSGPTSKAVSFGLQTCEIWGLTLRPAGFARYLTIDASDVTNASIDGRSHPAFSAFAPLLDIVTQKQLCADEIAARIVAFLLSCEGHDSPHLDQVLACQEALRDPELSSVAQLCERVDLGRRSLERLCGRYFGFPPKVLLRRQRFLRSLEQFMMSEDRSWSRVLDGQYYDQAHFVRDFRAFMGMTPTQYAERRHPILAHTMARHMAEHEATAPTGLPTILRYGVPYPDLG